MSYAQYIPTVAIGLIVLGIILLIGYALTQSKGKVDFAFGGFIGPFPFGFASSPFALKILIAALFILAIIMFFVRP